MIRFKKSLTKEFKKRRLFLKNRKSKLRQKKESIEGPETYQSDIGLLNADLPPMHNVVDDSCDKKNSISRLGNRWIFKRLRYFANSC